LTLGDFRLFSLSDGFFGLDGGAMFGVVPRPVWARTNPPDERNRIRLALRPLLVVTPTDRILVDAGIGDKEGAEFRDLYRVEKPVTLPASLARAGFRPEDVTKVVLTHLHFDHCGGATRLGEDGKPVPTFPNARHYVQQKEWDLALNPNRRSRAAYLPDNFLPLRQAGQLDIVEGNIELVPGLELVLTGGHSPGHQIVLIRDNSEGRSHSSPHPPPLKGEGERSAGEEAVGGQRSADGARRTAVYWSDLVPTGSHIATPYIMGYDLFPLETMAQKERLVQLAVSGRWICYTGHDPETACGIIREESGRQFLEPLAQ
jgi:glyoxylase-like metal-dependent hydrolase (beta-lactamase superfamily II)